MSKEKTIKICNIVAFIFTLSFLLKLVRDVFVYNTTLNSAPFVIWVLVDILYYLLPAAIVFLLGRVVKYRMNKMKNDTDSSV